MTSNADFNGTPLFNVEYLWNGTMQRHSYYGIPVLIETYALVSRVISNDLEWQYDMTWYDIVYLTCSKKLTCSQLSPPHETNRKIKEKRTKNKSRSMISLVRSRDHEGSPGWNVEKVRSEPGVKEWWMMRVVMMTEMSWQVNEEVRWDTTGETDGMSDLAKFPTTNSIMRAELLLFFQPYHKLLLFFQPYHNDKDTM